MGGERASGRGVRRLADRPRRAAPQRPAGPRGVRSRRRARLRAPGDPRCAAARAGGPAARDRLRRWAAVAGRAGLRRGGHGARSQRRDGAASRASGRRARRSSWAAPSGRRSRTGPSRRSRCRWSCCSCPTRSPSCGSAAACSSPAAASRATRPGRSCAGRRRHPSRSRAGATSTTTRRWPGSRAGQASAASSWSTTAGASS